MNNRLTLMLLTVITLSLYAAEEEQPPHYQSTLSTRTSSAAAILSDSERQELIELRRKQTEQQQRQALPTIQVVVEGSRSHSHATMTGSQESRSEKQPHFRSGGSLPIIDSHTSGHRRTGSNSLPTEEDMEKVHTASTTQAETDEEDEDQGDEELPETIDGVSLNDTTALLALLHARAAEILYEAANLDTAGKLHEHENDTLVAAYLAQQSTTRPHGFLSWLPGARDRHVAYTMKKTEEITAEQDKARRKQKANTNGGIYRLLLTTTSALERLNQRKKRGEKIAEKSRTTLEKRCPVIPESPHSQRRRALSASTKPLSGSF